VTSGGLFPGETSDKNEIGLRACLKIHRDRIILAVILMLKKPAKTDDEDEDEHEAEK
jgi:hypothetical protein